MCENSKQATVGSAAESDCRDCDGDLHAEWVIYWRLRDFKLLQAALFLVFCFECLNNSTEFDCSISLNPVLEFYENLLFSTLFEFRNILILNYYFILPTSLITLRTNARTFRSAEI